MKKIGLLLFSVVALVAQNAYAYDFYTQTIGGAMNGQVRYFTSLNEANPNGWVAYSMETLDPKSLAYLEHRYMINCQLKKVAITQPTSESVLAIIQPLGNYSDNLQGAELHNILGAGCKA